jgi:hypothetical protein
MGCLAIFLNFLLPGLGTILFTSKRVAGFIQLFLSVFNLILSGVLTVVTLGLWGMIGIFIHLGLFVWSLASSISFMSERAAKKAIQQERN